MYLEQSKENIKTFLDTIRSPSPILLNHSLSNGTIDNELIPPLLEATIPKAKSPEKTLEFYELGPEIPATTLEKRIDSTAAENSDLKIDPELESANLPIDPVISVKITEPDNNVLDSTARSTKFEKDYVSRKLIKTDSFKGLPRKFSITLPDGLGNFGRRSSLTRTDRAKNEIKRETFVSFVGPREIKPIDPLSSEVRNAVNELTNFIKLNMMESPSGKSERSSEIAASSRVDDTVEIKEGSTDVCCNSSQNNSLEILTKADESLHKTSSGAIKPELQMNQVESIVNQENTTVQLPDLQTTKTVSLAARNTENTTKKNDQNIPTLLRPADYIKAATKNKELSHICFAFSEKNSSDTGKKSAGNNSVKIQESKIEQTTSDRSTVSILKTESGKSKDNFLSRTKGLNESFSSFSRNQAVTTDTFELKHSKGFHKANSLDRDTTFGSRLTHSDIICKNLWKSTTSNNNTTVTHKFSQDINTSNSSHNLNTSDHFRIRASSVDPGSAGYSTTSSHDQNFQSKLLRMSPIKSDSTNKGLPSEMTTSKTDDFRIRSNDRKEVTSEVDKLFQKTIIGRGFSKIETKTGSNSVGENRNSEENRATTSFLHNPSTSRSSFTGGFLSRQKYKLTEQQRDSYSEFEHFNKANKLVTATASRFKSEKGDSLASKTNIKDSVTVKNTSDPSHILLSKNTVSDKNRTVTKK